MAKKQTETHILDVLEEILNIAQNSNLDFAKMKNAEKLFEICQEKLGINSLQSIFFAILVDLGSEDNIIISQISEHLGCRPIKIMRHLDEIEDLVKKSLVVKVRTNTFRVPSYVITSLKDNKLYTPEKITNLTNQQLISELDNLISLREESEIDFELFYSSIMSLLENNKQIPLANKILNLTDHDDKLNIPLLVYLCTSNVFYSRNEITMYEINDIYDRHNAKLVKHYLMLSCMTLQVNKIIENSYSDGFADRESYKLTETAKNDFLQEFDLRISASKDPNRLNYDSISEKQLFYNNKEDIRIKQLTEILEQNKLKKIVKNLEKNNLRKGFTCLFYGAPGTGKTESVYQIARKTKRDIIQINIAKIKSMWVGESEKNIKNFFDAYRTTVESSDVAPILLFNEADAIITKRNAGAGSAVDKMENSLQNIILQEMENINGILIATSNLVENMDKAFERRFLYKIKFEKPETQIKQKIWKSMLPTLTDNQIETIAKKYDFSGGQIENIARKITIANILSNKKRIDTDLLQQFCDDEFLDLNSRKKNVGF